MEETREIHALLHLIDDPDHEVFDTVRSRIIAFGKQIIPNLEHLWENTPDSATQERIEMLIHRLHLEDLQRDLLDWVRYQEQDLLSGVLLVSRYQYPELNLDPARRELEKIRRSIWLELNPFLTILEQVNVLSNILFNYHHIKGSEVNYSRPDEFLLPKLLETKKGNAISNGLLLLIMARMLDINLDAIGIPRQFILACFQDQPADGPVSGDPAEAISFFLDGASGQLYSHQDVEVYFKRIGARPSPSFFRRLTNKEIIRLLLREFSKCFGAESQRYKQEELNSLEELLDTAS
ncbi:MAG TPA: transglutaminase family protein [Lacibacter sp.]|nr:transglutaminase family protein [Lacibacter sp.]HMO88958.1 transglutaminase family protein [Lacibacter sp.]